MQARFLNEPHQPIAAMKTWIRLLLCTFALAGLSSCASGEYKVTSGQGDDHQPYQEWNWLPKNS